MKVYQTDYMGDGRFVAEIEATRNPMFGVEIEPGVFDDQEYALPAGAVEIAPPAFEEPSYPVWTGEGWQIVTPEPEAEPEPSPEPEPGPTVLYAADLWRRTSNEEADQINAAMQAQPFRIRQIMMTAQTYRSDDELWPLLEQAANDLFGQTRAAQLLAPSA